MPIVLYVNMYCTSKKRDIIGVFKIIQEKKHNRFMKCTPCQGQF